MALSAPFPIRECQTVVVSQSHNTVPSKYLLQSSLHFDDGDVTRIV